MADPRPDLHLEVETILTESQHKNLVIGNWEVPAETLHRHTDRQIPST